MNDAFRYNANRYETSAGSAYYLTALTFQFQLRAGLEADGKLGPATATALSEITYAGADYNVRRFGLPENAAQLMAQLGRAFQVTYEHADLTVDGKVGPATQRALAIQGAYTADAIDLGAVVAAAESHLGTPYVFGGMSSDGIDCSGLIKLACTASGVYMPRRGSWTMMQFMRDALALLPISSAITMPGAILYSTRSEPWYSERPTLSHIEMVARAGETIGARPRRGTGNWPTEDRGWTYAALLPGVDYTG